jgi:lysophospholipase L1-like esterase
MATTTATAPEQVTEPEFSRAKSLLTIFLVALALLPPLELAVRIRQWVRYGSPSNGLFETFRDPKTGLEMALPNQAAGRIHTDSHGFRSPEPKMPKPPGTIRLAFLGESNTFSQEASSDEATWPYLVWQRLQRNWPDQHFDFINASLAGYTTSESDLTLKTRVAPLRPDIIVINHASIDLYVDTKKLAAEQGLLHRDWTTKLQWLDRWSIAFKLVRQSYETRTRLRRAATSDGTLKFDPASLSNDFHRRLSQLVDDAKKQSSAVVLVSFPYKARRSQSAEQQLQNCETTILYGPWMSVKSTLDGFDEYNRVVAQVAKEKGIMYVDVRDAIPGTSQYFYDSVHYKDAGAELLAAKVADELIESDTLNEFLSKSTSSNARVTIP